LGNVGSLRRYRRVVQLELNEISRDLIGRLVTKGRLPNFRRLLQSWTFIETESEKQYNLLEPWIQWTSAHTGQPYSGHGIFRLSDSDSLAVPQIWEVLSERHIESAVIGSLNAVRGGTTGGMFFPDPWAKDAQTYPAELQRLWNLVSRRVQGHATDSAPVRQSVDGLLDFLRLRLPFSVYCHIAGQVLSQSVDQMNRWRLASAFDHFLAAFFLRRLRETQFGFYTLFLNSVAHYQHHYWRNHEPEKFNPKVKSPDCHVDQDPVAHGYEQFDRILGKVLEQVQDEDTLVIIASGLSQVPFTEKEHEGGMNYYRLKRHAAFVDRLGIRGVQVFPLMSRDWQLRCNTPKDCERAVRALDDLRVDGEKLFRLESTRESHIFIETAVTRALPPTASITGADGAPIPFHGAFACIAIKSGHHHDRGSVWLSIPNEQWTAPRRMPVWDLFHIGVRALLGSESVSAALIDRQDSVRA
jgi:hypothetical protein